MSEAKPYPKTQQLARGERRHHRKVASPQRWQRIIDAKGGPCRVCGDTGPVEFHHLVPRAIGGDDTEANIVPLCHGCHELVTRRDKTACAALRANLQPGSRGGMAGDEESYARQKLGDARFEERYPVAWEKAS